MEKLQNYKNIHKDCDIYIIASGKTLDFIDNSFLKNKLTIGINQVYKKIEPKYLVRKEIEMIDSVINTCKKTIHFISISSYGNHEKHKKKNENYIKKKFKNNDNIVLYDHNNNNIRLTKLPDNPDKIVVSHSTITTGIHLAAYMGAKNIILIGHDCGTIDGEPNFNGYHTDETYKIVHKEGKKGYINWLKCIENDTVKLKKLLKQKYGCNVYSLNPFINFGLEGHVYKK